MAGGRPLLGSTKLRLYFALILIILIILGPSGLLSVSNTRTSCLELYHSQEIGFKGEDCIRGVNAILGSRRSVKLLSHASRSSIRVSYYYNPVATFRPIINLIHDIELNPGPFQASGTNKKTSSSSGSTASTPAHMHNQQSLLRKDTQQKPWMTHFNCRRLLRHIDGLRLIFTRNHPLVIAISETWLNDTVIDSEVHISAYQMFRLDRSHVRKGGGVAIYLLDDVILSMDAKLSGCNLR